MKTIVIVGGGITGLSAAYFIQKKVKAGQLDANVVLAEASGTLGGKIRTVRQGEFMMETGADSIVARKPNVAPFIEELGLQGEVVYNATGKSYIHTDGVLKPVPDDTVFGIPMSIRSLAESTLVSAEGKVEALKDFYTENDSFTKNDSIGLFLERFLGKELVEKQIAPVLSGVYNGELSGLTIASTLPYLLDYKNEYGSIIKGLGENRGTFQRAGNRKFLSFKGGMSALVDELEKRLEDVEIVKGSRAERIAKAANRYSVSFAGGRAIEADCVVLGVPHQAARTMLGSEELDADFDRLRSGSMTSVYISFDVPDGLLPKDGTGFINAGGGDLVCDACTWTSRKWEHTSADRRLLVRLFYKSSNAVYESLRRLSEDELLGTALRDVEKSLGLAEKPLDYTVTKWNDAMPNYVIGHQRIVESLTEKLERLFPGVLLAGCSYYGVGIPDCIASGERTAERIFEQLTAGF
ncbi:protoporphyrinogen oxidase [Paenibacillus arenilitoris]|uniref:Coproporphyrinogen III oxidase n=1 Tax=Paenibacillus arenilitoris TaxID=2772299 RepID=A0A927CM18_9BACL|nr:protoporphyrinogen oxidase [Paenibacillus arenilitoris]MBD2868656.1 protoporphyrinogen oxidase [Paenibacillus arenilitoris]